MVGIVEAARFRIQWPRVKEKCPLTQVGVGDDRAHPGREVAEHGEQVESFGRLVVRVLQHLHEVERQDGWEGGWLEESVDNGSSG